MKKMKFTLLAGLFGLLAVAGSISPAAQAATCTTWDHKVILCPAPAVKELVKEGLKHPGKLPSAPKERGGSQTRGESYAVVTAVNYTAEPILLFSVDTTTKEQSFGGVISSYGAVSFLTKTGSQLALIGFTGPGMLTDGFQPSLGWQKLVTPKDQEQITWDIKVEDGQKIAE